MLTKITAPKLKEPLLIRHHLFDRLDPAEHEAAIWLAGPAGSGKTSLIASYLKYKRLPAIWYQIDSGDSDISNLFYYLNQAAAPFLNPKDPPLPLLTPEYHAGVDTFVRRYFETLFQRLQAPLWIVLDNFQEIGNDATLARLLVRIVEMAPAPLKVVVISRHNPPPNMARLHANQMLKTIDGQLLPLSLKECRHLMAMMACDWPEESLVEVHRLTKGWLAGLILLSLHGSFDPHAPHGRVALQPSGLFDYFAAEVLKTCDPQTRAFLTQTAFLPSMTVEMATQMTQMDAAAIIARLQHQNFFIQQSAQDPPSYQYHPLFRGFLMQTAARNLSEDASKEIMNRGAEILAQSGLGREAVELYRQAGSFEPLADFVLSQAPSLAAQGRTDTLRHWVAAFPAAEKQARPWLVFWEAVCRMHKAPAEAKTRFGEAFDIFASSEDVVGQVYSWSALVQVFLMIRGTFDDLDRWIGEGQRLEALIPEEAGPDLAGRHAAALLFALSLRHLGHEEFFRIQERCENLLPHCSDPQVLDALGSYLSMSYLWMGQTRKMELMLALAKPMMTHSEAPPVAKLNYLTVSTLFSIMVADWERARQRVAETLTLSAATGIRVYDFSVHAWASYVGIWTGDSHYTQTHVDAMAQMLSPRAVWDTGLYYYILALSAFYAGNLSKCRFHLDEALRVADSGGTAVAMGTSRGLLAAYLMAKVDLTAAMAVIDGISEVGVSQQTGHVFFIKELLLADRARLQHREAAQRSHLKAALADVAKNGHMLPLGLRPERLAALMGEAIRGDIEADIAKEIIQRFQLVPPAGAVVDEAWPWPIKVFTLGRFDIRLDNEPLAATRKTPKKPLDLLMLLICKDGQGIPREAAMDQLWPETEGDRAVQNMNTTLHRLRKWLGRDDGILLENGYLSLNRDLCWVDAWCFEALIKEASCLQHTEGQLELLRQSIERYKGGLSGSQADLATVTGYAQRLQGAWVDAVSRLGRMYLEEDQVESAKQLYENALAVDEAAEPVYQALIRLLQDQNRLGEAQHVLGRCKAVLSKMGVDPMPDTLALSDTLKARL